jgi:hypothetical protein
MSFSAKLRHSLKSVVDERRRSNEIELSLFYVVNKKEETQQFNNKNVFKSCEMIKDLAGFFCHFKFTWKLN